MRRNQELWTAVESRHADAGQFIPALRKPFPTGGRVVEAQVGAAVVNVAMEIGRQRAKKGRREGPHAGYSGIAHAITRPRRMEERAEEMMVDGGGVLYR